MELHLRANTLPPAPQLPISFLSVVLFPPCINGHLKDGSMESPCGVLKRQIVDTLQVRGRFGEEPMKSEGKKKQKTKRSAVTRDRWTTACRVRTVKCALDIMSSPPLLSAGCRQENTRANLLLERNFSCVSMNHEIFGGILKTCSKKFIRINFP